MHQVEFTDLPRHLVDLPDLQRHIVDLTDQQRHIVDLTNLPRHVVDFSHILFVCRRFPYNAITLKTTSRAQYNISKDDIL